MFMCVLMEFRLLANPNSIKYWSLDMYKENKPTQLAMQKIYCPYFRDFNGRERIHSYCWQFSPFHLGSLVCKSILKCCSTNNYPLENDLLVTLADLCDRNKSDQYISLLRGKVDPRRAHLPCWKLHFYIPNSNRYFCKDLCEANGQTTKFKSNLVSFHACHIWYQKDSRDQTFFGWEQSHWI